MVDNEAMDLGNAPEIYVSGISSVEHIGPNTVRLTLYSRHRDGNRVAVYTVWDAGELKQHLRITL